MFVHTVPYSVLSTFWWIPGLQFLVYLSTLRCLVTNSYKIEWQELPFVSLALLYSTYPHPIDQLAMLHIRVTEISIDSVLRMLLSSDIYIYIYYCVHIVLNKTSRQTIFLCLTFVSVLFLDTVFSFNQLFVSFCLRYSAISFIVSLFKW